MAKTEFVSETYPTPELDAHFRELVRDGIDPKEIADEVECIMRAHGLTVDQRVTLMLAASMLRETPRKGSIFAEIQKQD